MQTVDDKGVNDQVLTGFIDDLSLTLLNVLQDINTGNTGFACETLVQAIEAIKGVKSTFVKIDAVLSGLGAAAVALKEKGASDSDA